MVVHQSSRTFGPGRELKPAFRWTQREFRHSAIFGAFDACGMRHAARSATRRLFTLWRAAATRPDMVLLCAKIRAAQPAYR